MDFEAEESEGEPAAVIEQAADEEDKEQDSIRKQYVTEPPQPSVKVESTEKKKSGKVESPQQSAASSVGVFKPESVETNIPSSQSISVSNKALPIKEISKSIPVVSHIVPVLPDSPKKKPVHPTRTEL